MSVFVPVPAVLITVALYYCLKSGKILPPPLFFFHTIVLTLWGYLWFHINFTIIYSSSVRSVMGVLIGITLNLYSIAVLTILILTIQEHGISSYFFESSSVSFIIVLYNVLYNYISMFSI